MTIKTPYGDGERAVVMVEYTRKGRSLVPFSMWVEGNYPGRVESYDVDRCEECGCWTYECANCCSLSSMYLEHANPYWLAPNVPALDGELEARLSEGGTRLKRRPRFDLALVFEEGEERAFSEGDDDLLCRNCRNRRGYGD